MRLVASLEHWDADSIPSQAQWVKDLVLPQLRYRSQLWLGSDPLPEKSIYHRMAKKRGGDVYAQRAHWTRGTLCSRNGGVQTALRVSQQVQLT